MTEPAVRQGEKTDQKNHVLNAFAKCEPFAAVDMAALAADEFRQEIHRVMQEHSADGEDYQYDVNDFDPVKDAVLRGRGAYVN